MEVQVQGRRVEDRAAAELRELVARLERSGLAERRADVRRLLESSRALLQGAAGPPPRPEPSARKLAGKFATLLRLALDGLVLAGFLWGAWSLLTHRGPLLEGARPEAVLALAGPGWLLLRQPAVREGLREVGLWLLYHLAWGWDWFAEAFSRGAMRRYSARLAAREVMWAWRRHRDGLLHRPGPRDVESFLELAYGARAAEAFRRGAEELGGPGWSLRGGRARNRAAERLAALRWSVLIRLFEGLAASGALWAPPPPPRSAPVAMPTPPPPAWETPPAAPPPEPVAAPSPELAERQVDLRDLIRRKRQDITTAYGWKLKTEGEIAQRDSYLRQTRKEIAELERELAALGE